jgi:hypothetical protein
MHTLAAADISKNARVVCGYIVSHSRAGRYLHGERMLLRVKKDKKPDKLACDKETHEQVWAWILNDRYKRSRESPYNNASHFIMCEDSM